MSAAATSTGPRVRSDNPAGAFTSILNAAVGGAASRLEQQVVGWTDRLNDTASGGAKQSAAAAGVDAGLRGKNPFWAAVTGAWRGGTPVVRAAIVSAIVATILLLVLSPVLLLVFLLSLLVIAAVTKAHASTK